MNPCCLLVTHHLCNICSSITKATYFICDVLFVPFWCDMGRQMLRKLHTSLQYEIFSGVP